MKHFAGHAHVVHTQQDTALTRVHTPRKHHCFLALRTFAQNVHVKIAEFSGQDAGRIKQGRAERTRSHFAVEKRNATLGPEDAHGPCQPRMT